MTIPKNDHDARWKLANEVVKGLELDTLTDYAVDGLMDAYARSADEFANAWREAFPSYEPPKRSPAFEAVRTVARNPWAWPGGYPLVLVMADSEIVCSACVKGNYRLILEATRDGHVDAWDHGGPGPEAQQWTAQGHMVLEGTAADYGETICANCGADVLETEPTPGAHSCRYVVEYIPNGNEEPETRTFTRTEALDRLDGWLKDPGAALDALDREPGAQQRLTPFAFYSAERIKE